MTWNKNMDDAPRDGTPSVVYIHESCEVNETDKEIIITEKSGKKHYFPKGSYVFTQRMNIEEWFVPQPPEVEG